MARTITQIHEELIAAKQARSELATLTSTSDVSIWRLWLYVVAVAIYTHELLFDAHKAEVLDIISRMKPHSLKWYAEKSRAYQHGDDLVDDADYYYNTGLTDSQIAEKKIVNYAAVVNVENGLRIKVATDNGTDLQALSAPQLAGFVAYMHRIKDAGVNLLITTQVADELHISLQVFYNPLILDNTGARLDGGGATTVQDAVKNYLKNLPFNGVFVLAYLVDVLQNVSGVVVPHVVSASAKYGSLDLAPFAVEYQPDSGYLRFVSDAHLEIQWIAKAPL